MLCLISIIVFLGDARTQSPPTKNCAPESPTFGEITSFNRTKCNARSPPEGTAFLITVPFVPGKLTSLTTAVIIYVAIKLALVVLGWSAGHELHCAQLINSLSVRLPVFPLPSEVGVLEFGGPPLESVLQPFSGTE